MNPSLFVGIFEIYEKHAPYFYIQRNGMLLYSTVSDIVIVFTLYVMKTSPIELMRTFRILMYCNVVFPALLCNEICLVFVPYIMFPYPVILNLGPLRHGSEGTLFYGVLFCWFGTCSVLSIAHSVFLKYISVCHFWLLRSKAFFILECISILVPPVVMIPASVVIPYLILSETQSIPSMLIADPRNAVFVDKFAAMVVYLKYSGVDLFLIFLLLLYIVAAIVGSAMIIRIILRIRARKHEFSPKTYRLHINVVVSLVMYCVILFVQLGVPIMLFVITLFFQLSWMTAMPQLYTMLCIPISLFALSTSVMYLIVIRPLRRSATRLITQTFNTVLSIFFEFLGKRQSDSLRMMGRGRARASGPLPSPFSLSC